LLPKSNSVRDELANMLEERKREANRVLKVSNLRDVKPANPIELAFQIALFHILRDPNHSRIFDRCSATLALGVE